ncbi:MAG: phBC6A51 family helix-turn-helix protein [Candidatus Hodarchaeales archaeon]
MTKYTKKMIDTIVELRKDSSNTVEEICKTVGISQETWFQWKKNKPEFTDALKKVEEVRLDNIGELAESALHKKLAGYSYDETTVTDSAKDGITTKTVTKHVAPSDTAIIFALTNAKKLTYKRNQEDDGFNPNTPIVIGFNFTPVKDKKE